MFYFLFSFFFWLFLLFSRFFLLFRGPGSSLFLFPLHVKRKIYTKRRNPVANSSSCLSSHACIFFFSFCLLIIVLILRIIENLLKSKVSDLKSVHIPFSHSFFHSFTHPFAHSFIYLFTYSLIVGVSHPESIQCENSHFASCLFFPSLQ